MNEIETFFRKEAALRGMDPDKIVEALNTEGGFSDPFRQSDVVKNGRRERSYGPMQLYIDGGVGNKAIAAGFDPRTDWQGAGRFGLDYLASKGNWGEWYGPQNAGLPLDYGLKGAKPIGMTMNSNPIASGGYASEGPMQEAHNRVVPPMGPGVQVADHPIADAPSSVTGNASIDGILGKLKTATGGGEGKGFMAGMEMLGGATSQPNIPQIRPSSISVDSMEPARVANAQQLMQTVLANRRKRVPGLSIMG